MFCKTFASFLTVVILAGCQSEPPSTNITTVFAANVMTIDYRIIIGESLNQEQKKLAESIIHQSFSDIDNTYNKWNPSSEISHLNHLKAKETAPITPALEKFLEQIQQIVEISENRFDPTIEPLQNLWKDKLSHGTKPSQTEIETVMPAVGWDKVHFSNGIFYKDHDQTSLDLGGIAKGLCVDMLVERLNAAGFKNVYVEWGGEIRASGKHPDDRFWNIYISRLNDTDPEHAIAHIGLEDQAIATSGDYLQNWTIQENGNAVTYFHILNPKTGTPLIATPYTIASASVLAPSCTLADGLATVAMMFPTTTEASEWLESVKQKYPSIEFWLVVRNQ